MKNSLFTLLFIAALALPASAQTIIKTSALPAGTTIGDADFAPAVQGGVSVKLTAAQWKTYCQTGMIPSSAIGSTVEGYDATILKSAAIGSTVQGYSAALGTLATSNPFIAGSGVAFSGSWPAITISATGGGGITIGSNASGNLTISSGVLDFSHATNTANGLVKLDGGGALPAGLLANYIGSTVQTFNANLAAISGGTWTGASSITTLGTVTSGSFPYANLTGAGTGVLTAGAQAVNTSGGFLTIGGALMNNGAGGTVADFNVTAPGSFYAPNVVLPNGPAGNLIAYGDSFTSGVGANPPVTSTGNFTGCLTSWPGYFATSSAGQNMTVYNLGISGQTTANGLTQYNQSGGSTTGTTASSTTLTITGSTTGMTGTMVLASSSGDIKPGTTGTISGSTVTLSQAATGSHAGQTIIFAASTTYGTNTAFATSAHLLSEAVTGVPTWFAMAYGSNDIYVGGVTSSGTAVTGNATISAMTINTGVSVGSAALTATTGYNAWSNGILLGTVSSATSSSVTLNTGALVNAAMTTFKFTPPLTTIESNITSTVNAALTDGDSVAVFSVVHCIYTTPGYNQQQYDENRLLLNQWIQSTYANGATAGVTFFDLANCPQFAISGAIYRNQAAQPHFTNQGYAVWASYINSQFALQYASSMQGNTRPFLRYGIAKTSLPVATIYGDQGNTYGSMAGDQNFNFNNVTNAGNVFVADTGLVSDTFFKLSFQGYLYLGAATNPEVRIRATNASGALQLALSYRTDTSFGNPANSAVVSYNNTLYFCNLNSDTKQASLDPTGHLSVYGGLGVAEGSNAKQGTATLVAGTVTVSDTAVTANSRIFLTTQSLGTVTVPKEIAVTARTAATSFTITSADATDTSVVAWEIFEPAP
jgi:hypothetical protein